MTGNCAASFTQDRFDSGGRLFGGFWQRLRKHERRQGLWINGEKAIELDYGQVGPRTLYGLAGQEPPADDLYHLWGYVQQRERRSARDERHDLCVRAVGEVPEAYPQSCFETATRLVRWLKLSRGKHPLIKDQFHRGLGHDAQSH